MTLPGTAERATSAVLVGPPDGAPVRDDVGLDAAVPAGQLPSRHAARGKRRDLWKCEVNVVAMDFSSYISYWNR